jgi:hypothetical protein
MNHAYEVLAPILGIVNALALLCVLVFLLLGPLARFWMVFFYVAWELLATAALSIADFFYHGSTQMAGAAQTPANKLYARLYWTNDVLVDLLRFILVIVLLYKATEGATKRAPKGLLALLVLAMAVLPFVLFHPSFDPWPRGAFFNSTSELMNFGAALMNLMLWAALIASRRRDPQLLMVSTGLGIVVTGTAIAYGIRHFIGQSNFGSIGYFFLNLTQLAGWLIWCRAFWPVHASRQALNNALPSS